MRAVFDHSWKVLTEKEQGILLRLSVFQGGFRYEAAEVVAGATLSALSSLVAKSLIRRSGAGRYDLHELIRHFATDQFARHPDEQAATQRRHSLYFMTFFKNEDARLRSSAQREALAELTAEMDNFRVAWDWAVNHGEFALIEQMLRAFETFYDMRGWLQEGLDALGHAVDMLETAHGQSPPDRINKVALGHMLVARSIFAFRLAQHEQARVQHIPTGEAVGLDVGLKSLVALSSGECVENPRWLRASLADLRRLQRHAARQVKGSQRQHKSYIRIARLSERTANQRADYLHKVSRRLITEYDLIAMEDLPLDFMNCNRHLSLSSHDAGFGLLRQMIEYKAAEAGIQIVAVNSAHTTQVCSQCGNVVPKDLSVRVHDCPSCGLLTDRDINAAHNVLQIALHNPLGRSGLDETWAVAPSVS